MRIGALYIVLGLLGVFSGIIHIRAQTTTPPVAETEAEMIPKPIAPLRLDASSPEDAIRMLGKPDKDEFDDLGFSGKQRLIGFNLKSLFEVPSKKNAFRKLTYKEIGGLESLRLRFLDGKLVQMILGYKLGKSDKKIHASQLGPQLRTGFVIFEGVAKESRLKDFEGQAQSSSPHVYGPLYLVLGVASDRVYFSSVSNRGSFWEVIRLRPSSNLFPGYLSELQIISRRLEKKT